MRLPSNVLKLIWLSSLLLLDPLTRPEINLGGTAQAELHLDPRPIGLDGLHVEVELFSDLAGSEALPYQVEHLQLPVGKEAVARRPAGGQRAGRRSGTR